MFTVAERDAVRDRILGLAKADPRVVAGAVVGSPALGDGDDWSDVDLTFAVAEGVPLEDVLDDWTRRVVAELDGTQLLRPTRELLGYAVHHAVRARASIGRDRPWQAAHWIGELRKEAIAIACRRRKLPDARSRGADDLPPSLLAQLEETLVRSLDPAELGRALRAAVDVLLAEAVEERDLGDAVGPRLRELVA